MDKPFSRSLRCARRNIQNSKLLDPNWLCSPRPRNALSQDRVIGDLVETRLPSKPHQKENAMQLSFAATDFPSWQNTNETEREKHNMPYSLKKKKVAKRGAELTQDWISLSKLGSVSNRNSFRGGLWPMSHRRSD